MALRALVDTVLRRWRWVLTVTALGLVAGVVLTAGTTPTYRSGASIFFSLQYGNSASDLVQGANYTQNQVSSFAALATTPAVLGPVINELSLDMSAGQLAHQVSAEVPVETVLVEVSVTDTSPDRAARIADAVAETLADRVENLAPRDAGGAPSVQATIVAPAEAPSSSATPNWPLNVLAGLLAGLVLGLVAAVARDSLDNRVRDAEALSGISTLPVIGSISRQPAGQGHPLVVEKTPHEPQAEFYRQLRTNLQFLEASAGNGDTRPLSVITVTSALPSEGKSTVSANLAAALAETGAAVLLVDADLRRPSVDRLLGLEGAAGLTSVLVGRAAVEDVVQEWGGSGLEVLTSGPLPPNPSELLGSPAMARLLSVLRGTYDMVVIDTPPLLPVADAVILSNQVDGTVVVANVAKVRRHQLAEGLGGLEHVGARVRGVVLNMVERKDATYRYGPEDGGTTRTGRRFRLGFGSGRRERVVDGLPATGSGTAEPSSPTRPGSRVGG